MVYANGVPKVKNREDYVDLHGMSESTEVDVLGRSFYEDDVIRFWPFHFRREKR